MNEPEIYCEDCGWEGMANGLECSDEDMLSRRPTKECRFIYCPSCHGTDISDIEEENDD